MKDTVLRYAEKAEKVLQDRFAEIDRISQFNTAKVLDAFQRQRVTDATLCGSTGYGYNDRAREALEAVYAEVFGGEDALVRHTFVNGTHTIATAFAAILRPGDTMLSVTGAPYDTLLESIGVCGEKGRGSLTDYNIRYRQVELLPDGTFDFPAIRSILRTDPTIRVIFLQRSRGYTQRKALTLTQIDELCREIRKDSDAVILADNCYGEFVCREEPLAHGVDLIAGSLIKNPGGGLAQTGGYIAGRKDLIELCANRLTTVGIGKECGATLDQPRRMFQGFFMAPHTVAQAMKTAYFAAQMLQYAGFEPDPLPTEAREDIIGTVVFRNPEKLLAFMRGIQNASPVDSFVTPEPCVTPGYQDAVVMAAGTFVQGASIELSADAPMREPYRAYFQGGLTYEAGKLAIMRTVEGLLHEE